MKKTELLALGVCAVLLTAPVTKAQTTHITWTATSTPVQTTLSGGPWTLAQGGPYTVTAGTTTAGGPFDGTTPYCSTTSGLPIVNNPSVVPPNPMQPFYFPFVMGSGLNLQGYFDYRPRDITEGIMAANSTDGGLTWHFQQQAENLSSVCPASDTNSTGNENGLGHSNLLTVGGGGYIYNLDRRNGHVDSDGLVVHRLAPKAGAPLNGIPAFADFDQPGIGTTPLSAVIAQWDMSQIAPMGFVFPVGANQSAGPAPNINNAATMPTATALGMTNSYSYTTGKHTYSGSVDAEDITSTLGGTDPSLNAMAWRIRGSGGENGTNTGNGWNTAAPQYTQGAQFMVNTHGYQNIVFQFDWYDTAQGPRDLQVRYTIDGSTWNNIPTGAANPTGGFYASSVANSSNTDAYYPGITVHLENVAGVSNNPNFGIQLVSAWDPTYTGTGAPTYTAGKFNATTWQPVELNNTSGNWRFDMIQALGTPLTVSTPLTFMTNTVGLTNPDGILASVPGAFPFKILYVDKTLNGDWAFNNSSQQCGNTPSGKSPNHDTAYVHYATSSDGIHWTEQGAVNGLNDPTTTSYSGIRYVAPNGTLIKLTNGNYGLFFGGGNCLDGDSDAFHAIMYAESPDLMNWTVVNGINNPIASVATVTNVTDPVTQMPVTIPANQPVIGYSSATETDPTNWFSGRVYGPQATVGGTSIVNLIFAGYNASYSGDLSDYRTIGNVQLQASPAILP